MCFTGGSGAVAGGRGPSLGSGAGRRGRQEPNRLQHSMAMADYWQEQTKSQVREVMEG